MDIQEEPSVTNPARLEMVDKQLRARRINHEGVLNAFATIPRELFVPPDQFSEAYADHPIPIGHGQTISQPYIVALMIQELDPKPAHRILDVGAGSGYQTAILTSLVKHVYAIERLEELTEKAINTLARLNVTNVTIWTGDGSLGYPEEAPFDGIICGASAPEVPQPWIDQLSDGGRIVTPIGEKNTQVLICLEKHGNEIRRRKLCDVRFVKLIGQKGW